MDITLSFLLFSFIILLYWVITELFTFFFRLTGLPDDRARFQVLSLLTGTGFTTRESELILGSRRRRRLARVTMLFGYVFNVTIVSALVTVFLSMKLVNFGAEYIGVLIPLFTIGVILVFLRVPKIRAWGENLFRRVADRVFDQQETFNAVMLLDYIGTESIVQVTLRHIPEEYRSYSFQVVLIPKMEQVDGGQRNDNRPSWAGLCENAITKNVDGPHDMASIRESIKSAERVSAI